MKNYILILLSAFMMGLSFTFKESSLIAWVGLVPYFYVVFNEKLTSKKAFKYGIAYGVTFYLFLLLWLFEMYPLNWLGLSNKDSIIVIVLGWIGFSLIEGGFLSLIPIIFKFTKGKKYYFNIISISFIWILIEWIQGLGILGFNWGKIAVSQAPNTYIIQSASLLGSLFISFLVVIINAMIATIIIKRKENLHIKNLVIGIALIFTSNIAFGYYNLNKEYDDRRIDVSVVQGNISSSEKWKSNALDDSLVTYERLSKEALDNAKMEGKEIELMIWPETAMPVNFFEKDKVMKKAKSIAIDNNIHFITGGFYSERTLKGDLDYNSVYTFNNKGDISGIYSKRHLVPFGEYIPYYNEIFKFIPGLDKLNAIGNNLTPGTETEVVETEYGNIAPIICFESIFPDLIRKSINDGGELITILTNDSWFKDSTAVVQHNNQAILRAVENNRYVIRAANTGISSVITNKGEVIAKIDPLVEGFINEEVNLISEKTLYTMLGEVIVFSAIMWIVVMIFIKRKKFI